MDAQTMNNISTVTETSGVSPHNTPRMTKEQAQCLTDSELLQMVENAAGHTTKDFMEFMNCDFSYTFLTNLLKDRGYENGWHKTSEGNVSTLKPTIISLKKSDGETVRHSFSLDKSIADEWNNFNKNIPFKSVTLGYALKRFMDDARAGKIKFEIEF